MDRYHRSDNTTIPEIPETSFILKLGMPSALGGMKSTSHLEQQLQAWSPNRKSSSLQVPFLSLSL